MSITDKLNEVFGLDDNERDNMGRPKGSKNGAGQQQAAEAGNQAGTPTQQMQQPATPPPAQAPDAKVEEAKKKALDDAFRVLTSLQVVSIGVVSALTKVNGTNYLMLYDKLARPQLALQMDSTDLIKLKQMLNKLNLE